MPLKFLIDRTEVQASELKQSPAVISYDLEDEKNFQSKGSSTAFDVTFPATLSNDQVFNTFRKAGVEDMSPNSRFRSARAAQIIIDNIPVLTGKALLKSGSDQEGYTVNFYGDNGDWIVDMQDLTLYDCLPTNTHVFALYGGPGTAPPPFTIGPAPYGIEDSWFFDGYNENQTWVYAPVRYQEAFADGDLNMKITQMRPSLYIYWIIYRAFKRSGYTISSQFMDSSVFRRLLMPWTWGNFLGINTKLTDLLKFRAVGPPYDHVVNHVYQFEKSPSGSFSSTSGSGYIFPGCGGNIFDDFQLSNTSSITGFDNNANYTFNNSTGEWKWTYKLANGYNFGKVTAYFGVTATGGCKSSLGSSASIYCEVYKNGSLIMNQPLWNVSASSFGNDNDTAVKTFNFSVSGLVVGDRISIKFRYNYFKSALGDVSMFLTAWDSGKASSSYTGTGTWYEMFRIEIEPGSTVDWGNFQQFKDYKFLDFLRGVLDLADIIPKTDNLTKKVVLEPSHPCSVGSTQFTGYFKTQRIDWTAKRDVSQINANDSYDELQRDYLFRFKDDSADAGIQIFNKRYTIEPGTGKYRFGPRFKEGTQTFENRFFSPVIHLKMTQWQQLDTSTHITPQIVCIVPEKVGDTSTSKDEPVFSPKICYFKGFVFDSGRFRMNGYTYPGYPYMFAVNYQPGGVNDIVLTYSDQQINGTVIPGLLRRFFLQRLAIMDNGVQYRPFVVLNSNDITNVFHRERIIIDGNLYLLTNIDKWDPLHPISTQVTMWRYVPVEQKYRDRVYPSSGSVLGTLTTLPSTDMAYQQLFILQSDLPTIS